MVRTTAPALLPHSTPSHLYDDTCYKSSFPNRIDHEETLSVRALGLLLASINV
jgi:hypothetical protein